MKINSVLIAGAGAVGLTVAHSIFKAAPRSVSILAKGERLDRYQKSGLWVNGEKLDLRLSHGEAADLVIVASKFHHLEKVISDITPSVGADTIILSLLNGISSEEIIGAKLGRHRLPLAMILGTDASYNSGRANFARKGVIYFGDADGQNGKREESIAEFFTRVGIDFKLDENMRRALWYKYMINVGANQTTAILRLPYSALQNKGGNWEIPEARLLFEKSMKEVIAVANAEGIDLNEKDIEKIYQTVNTLDPVGSTSMCQDVLAGRKTELEMFCGAMMKLGKKHNIPVPVNEIFYLQLRSIEKKAIEKIEVKL